MTRALLLLVFFLPATLPGQTSATLDRLQQLAATNNLDTPTAQPFHLKLALTLLPQFPDASTQTGAIELWYSDPTHIRTTYDLPTYHSTTVRSGDQTFRTRGAGEPPVVPAYLLRHVLTPISDPSRLAGAKFKSISRKIGSLSLSCILVENSSNGNSYCTETNTPILRVSSSSLSYVRQRTGLFHSIHVPLALELTFYNTLIAKASITTLEGQPAPYPAMQSTDGLAPILEPPLKPAAPPSAPPRVLKAGEPEMPDAARKRNLSGSALVQIIVGPDGHVQSAEPVAATDPIFTQPSLDAVRKYLFFPWKSPPDPPRFMLQVETNFQTQ